MGNKDEPDKLQLDKYEKGDIIHVDPFLAHRFWAQDIVARFIEVSTHDDPDDSYRIVPSGPRPFI